MRFPNLPIHIVLITVLLALIAACAPAEPPPTPTATPVVVPMGVNGEPIAARVNTQEISFQAYERSVSRAEQQMLGAADPAALRATVLNTLIEQVLIEQDAARQQIAVTDAEVETEVQALVSSAGSADAWQQWLATNLYTEEELRAELRASLLNSKMQIVITADLDGEVPHVHARHILVGTEAEANSLLARLQAGEDFAALASVSLDTATREQGGDLGWFTQDELIDPALGTIAFSLQSGQIAGPVPSILGYHIIQTLESANRPLTEERRAQLAQREFETWLASLVASATIERFI